jgi:hypothetical protein
MFVAIVIMVKRLYDVVSRITLSYAVRAPSENLILSIAAQREPIESCAQSYEVFIYAYYVYIFARLPSLRLRYCGYVSIA